MIPSNLNMAPKPRPKSFEHFLKDLFHGSLSICNAQKQIQREYTTYFHKESTNDTCLIINYDSLSVVDPKLSGFNFISISRIGRNIGRFAKSVFQLAHAIFQQLCACLDRDTNLRLPGLDLGAAIGKISASALNI